MDYRSDIIFPLNDFFRFEHKALVSATPIPLHDPRFRTAFPNNRGTALFFDYKKELWIYRIPTIHCKR